MARTNTTHMKKLLFLGLIATVPFLLSFKDKPRGKNPGATVLEKNTNWSGQVAAYSLAGPVEIHAVTSKDPIVYNPLDKEHLDTNIYVLWYDPSGNIIAHTTIVGKGMDAATSIIPNKTLDTFIVVGLFTDTVLVGDKQLVGSGKQDAFIACFIKDGTCLWARASGGKENDYAKRSYFDQKGGIVMVGMYFAVDGDTIHFDDYHAIAWKSGTNVIEPTYRLSDGELISDTKGIIVK